MWQEWDPLDAAAERIRERERRQHAIAERRAAAIKAAPAIAEAATAAALAAASSADAFDAAVPEVGMIIGLRLQQASGIARAVGLRTTTKRS